ncbi:MAG TPA: hypothetical protein VMZ50_09940 [Phycisphaerae bacterium]|nr:hypothetical protein [Phycisphaerae bacterium]
MTGGWRATMGGAVEVLYDAAGGQVLDVRTGDAVEMHRRWQRSYAIAVDTSDDVDHADRATHSVLKHFLSGVEQGRLAVARSLWAGAWPEGEALLLTSGWACALCRAAVLTQEPWPNGLHPCDCDAGWHVVCPRCVDARRLVFADEAAVEAAARAAGCGPEEWCWEADDMFRLAPLKVCPDGLAVADELMGRNERPDLPDNPIDIYAMMQRGGE